MNKCVCERKGKREREGETERHKERERERERESIIPAHFLSSSLVFAKNFFGHFDLFFLSLSEI